MMKIFHKGMALALAALLSVSMFFVPAFAEGMEETQEPAIVQESVMPEESAEPEASSEEDKEDVTQQEESVTEPESAAEEVPAAEEEVTDQPEEVSDAEAEALTEAETEPEPETETESEPEEVLLDAAARIDIAETDVSGISDQTYKGEAIKPKPVVTYYGLTLEEGTDYELSYEDNVKAGTATVTIKGIGNNYGEKQITFKINPLAIKPVIELSKTTFIYNGKAQQPVQSMITVKNGSETLPSSAYSLSYSSGRKEAGVYYVYVTMKGNYAGKASKAYRINCSAPKITSIVNTRTGTGISWAKVNGAKKYRICRKTLNKSTAEWSEKWTWLADTESLSYTDKKAASGAFYKYAVYCISEQGKSTSGYKAKNNQYIASPKISSVRNMNAGLKVAWSKVSGAGKYIVYRKFGNGDWVKVGTIYGLAFTDKAAKNGRRYSYAVRAVTSDGRFHSASSPLKVGVRVARPVISGLSSPSKKAIRVRWTKNSLASGYMIQISTNSTFTANVKNYVVKGSYSAATIKNLLAKKRYYVHMRTYKTVGGVNYYSSWSVAKNVKTK